MQNCFWIYSWMSFNNIYHRGRVTLLLNLGRSLFLQSGRFSTLTSCSDWVRRNQLFQRHPRLQLFEEKWSKTFGYFKQFVAYVFVSGLNRNPFVMSRILYLGLVELEGVNEMEKSKFGVKMFNQIRDPNLFSWNTMIRFFATYDSLRAFGYYTEMLERETVPDKYTFPFLLQGCGGAGFNMDSVKQVHCHTVKLVLDCDLFVQNSLLNSYMVCDSTTDALSVFDEMPVRDVVSWTSLISGLVSQSNFNDAIHLFINLVSAESQPQINDITIISTMSACGGLGSVDLTKCFHAWLLKAGWFQQQNVSIVNSLIDAYAKCGDLCYVREVFDDIQNNDRDLYSWTAIISAYAMHGQGLDALNMFSRMEQECKAGPDVVTLVAILSACAHSGLVGEGLCIFESMRAKYGIEPDLRHYGCIVDLLGRAGMVDRAFDVVENLPMEPNLAVLGSLLNGCKLHNNLHLGEAVLRKIDLQGGGRGGTGVLLSNMYANERRWNEVMEIRKEWRGKPPGRSWIEDKDGVHEFVARNDIDPQLYFIL